MEQILEWVSRYGYLAIFVILMLGMLWVPLPEETFLTGVGVLASHGHIHPVLAGLAAYAGTTVGITGMYLLGRYAGFAIVRRFGKLLRVTPERLKMAHEWFDRRGKWTLTFGYYIPYVRHLNAIVAGTAKISYREFAAYAYPGGAVWVCTFIALGYVLGDQWRRVTGPMESLLLISGAVAVGVFLVILAHRHLRKVRRG